MRKGLKLVSNIRQDYFQWLCEIIYATEGETSYWFLAKKLYNLYFDYIKIQNDENRAMDGLALRKEFIRYYTDSTPIASINAEEYDRMLTDHCSILEMLIALARRINFELEDLDEGIDRTSDYFWEMMHNLGLDVYTDDTYSELNGDRKCVEVVNRLVNRRYHPSGSGGLFPLSAPQLDQRYLEIWSQKNAYLIERY